MKSSLFGKIQEEIEIRERREGITAADILTLPAPQRRVLNKITRSGEMSLTQLSQEVNIPLSELEPMLETLVEKGYLNRRSQVLYRVSFGKKEGRALPLGLWDSLGQRTE